MATHLTPLWGALQRRRRRCGGLVNAVWQRQPDLAQTAKAARVATGLPQGHCVVRPKPKPTNAAWESARAPCVRQPSSAPDRACPVFRAVASKSQSVRGQRRVAFLRARRGPYRPRQVRSGQFVRSDLMPPRRGGSSVLHMRGSNARDRQLRRAACAGERRDDPGPRGVAGRGGPGQSGAPRRGAARRESGRGGEGRGGKLNTRPQLCGQK